VGLKEKPLTSWKNRSWAQGEVKPLEKRGLKVQSPIGAAGVIGKHKKKLNIFYCHTFSQ